MPLGFGVETHEEILGFACTVVCMGGRSGKCEEQFIRLETLVWPLPTGCRDAIGLLTVPARVVHHLRTDARPTALTGEANLWSRGLLEDRSRHDSVEIFSLLELEEGIGTDDQRQCLVRVSRTEAALADVSHYV